MTQHKFRFTEIDLDDLSSETEIKADKKFVSSTSIRDDVKNMSKRIGDMQALNLFGVSVSSQNQSDDHYHREIT